MKIGMKQNNAKFKTGDNLQNNTWVYQQVSKKKNINRLVELEAKQKLKRTN